jgi:hypothetical protein
MIGVQAGSGSRLTAGPPMYSEQSAAPLNAPHRRAAQRPDINKKAASEWGRGFE